MNKLILCIVFGFMMVSSSGCVSYLSYKDSQREIVGRRVAASGNENAIRAYAMGDTVGIGINVLAYEALTEHPWRQLGAAILDAGTLWVLSEGIQELNSNRSKSRDSNGVTINGEGNNVTIVNNSDNTTVNRDQDNSTATSTTGL